MSVGHPTPNKTDLETEVTVHSDLEDLDSDSFAELVNTYGEDKTSRMRAEDGFAIKNTDIPNIRLGENDTIIEVSQGNCCGTDGYAWTRRLETSDQEHDLILEIGNIGGSYHQGVRELMTAIGLDEQVEGSEPVIVGSFDSVSEGNNYWNQVGEENYFGEEQAMRDDLLDSSELSEYFASDELSAASPTPEEVSSMREEFVEEYTSLGRTVDVDYADSNNRRMAFPSK